MGAKHVTLGLLVSATLTAASCDLVLGIEELPVRSSGGAGGGTVTATTSSQPSTTSTAVASSSSTGCGVGVCGPSCPIRCDGDPCDTPGQCESQSCVDGVCCAGPCNGLCKACNVDGQKGMCTAVPAAKPDDSCVALGQPPVACNGAEKCYPAPGSPCGPAGECSAGVCLYGLCKYALGTDCENDLDCATSFCSAGKCAQCTGPGDCDGTQCVLAGSQYVCLLPNTAFCMYDSQCNSGTCNPSSHVCI